MPWIGSGWDGGRCQLNPLVRYEFKQAGKSSWQDSTAQHASSIRSTKTAASAPMRRPAPLIGMAGAVCMQRLERIKEQRQSQGGQASFSSCVAMPLRLGSSPRSTRRICAMCVPLLHATAHGTGDGSERHGRRAWWVSARGKARAGGQRMGKRAMATTSASP